MKALLFVLALLAFATSVHGQQKPDDGIDDEKAVKVFSYLLDGETTARIHLADLRRIATTTPYTPLIIVGVSRQLLVWGWKQGESKDLIKACANAATGVGADDERFAKIALFVGRLTDTEESTYASLSGLEDEGVPAWRIVAKMIGRSVEETKSLSLERRLKPRRLAEALVAGFNEMYGGAAEREAKRIKEKALSDVEAAQVEFAKGFDLSLKGDGCSDCSVTALTAAGILIITDPRVAPRDAANAILNNSAIIANLKKFGFKTLRVQQRAGLSSNQLDFPIN